VYSSYLRTLFCSEGVEGIAVCGCPARDSPLGHRRLHNRFLARSPVRKQTISLLRQPADTFQRVAEYDNVPYKNFADDVMRALPRCSAGRRNVAAVGEAIVKIVDAPFGKRPFPCGTSIPHRMEPES